jgi:hypothetical protein
MATPQIAARIPLEVAATGVFSELATFFSQ